ncbi:MAG: oxidoreductase [Chloroflexi bacterium]|nr:oxidoreductase [Chloroflexota bacterium]
MNKNIAVVGCGYWGKNLVRNFAQLGALHTICDTDSERLQQQAALYPGLNLETDFTKLLSRDEIRGVVIATPAALHYSMAKEALLSGKDILVEKPLALKVEEGRELVALAEEKGRILMVGHVLEYHPAVIKLKELIDHGDLGKVQYIYSNRLNLGKFRTEENILWSFAPHDISVILLLLHELPQEVSAHGGYYLNNDIADVTLTTMSFASGVRAHIFVSWLHPYKEQRMVIVGDKKMVLFDDVAPKEKLVVYNHRVDWIERLPVPRQEDAQPMEFTMAEPLRLECQHFLECMEARQRPRTDGHSGLRVLQILDACQRSLQEKGTVVSLSLSRETQPFVHPTSIVEQPWQIGEGTRVWHFCHIMPEVSIGKNCVIGQNAFIGRGVKIGNNVKIENNVSIYEGVTLEDGVFCGPSCTFTNVINPRSHISRRSEFRETLVKKGATIGANATIVCGNTIGEYAFIGAGAVVTSDVLDYALAYGNPARRQGWVCQCGVKLDFGSTAQAQCAGCRRIYERQGTEEIRCCEGWQAQRV